MKKWSIVRLVIMVVSAVMVVNLSRSIWDLWRRRDYLGERQAALARLKAEQVRFQGELREAESPEFIEQEARNRLGLGKEGEIVVLMPNDKFQMSNVKTEEKIVEKLPNWKRWWRLFF
ncbi:septum formation initiator family protein [Candidatus Gottesmanbacteria bacterium]|nr:septum formation initiator family protein [Candidatus Gottesmanbacteria bacterium]